jgi:hypothetical protein
MTLTPEDVLTTLTKYAEILDKRAKDATTGNCVSLELTKQRARIALSEAISAVPQDTFINSVASTSITTEFNFDTAHNLAKILLVNHSLILELLLLDSMEGVIECLTFQGTLLGAMTNTTPSNAFAHIRHEVLSNVQGQ